MQTSNSSMLLDYVDVMFNVNNIENYSITFQISTSGISFCVVDIKQRRHIALRHYQYNRNITNCEDLDFEVTSILKSDKITNLPYPKAICVYISQKHTLIPASIFDKEKLFSIFSFISPIDELDEIHYKQFLNEDIYSCYVVPSPLAASLLNQYKDIYFYNQSYSLICSCLKFNPTDPSHLHINLNEGMADIALCMNGEFKFHNSFNILHLNDAIYYINALLYYTFKTSSITMPIYISGDLLLEEINELKKYFPLLTIQSENNALNLIGYENSYRYYNLFSIASNLCE